MYPLSLVLDAQQRIEAVKLAFSLTSKVFWNREGGIAGPQKHRQTQWPCNLTRSMQASFRHWRPSAASACFTLKTCGTPMAIFQPRSTGIGDFCPWLCLHIPFISQSSDQGVCLYFNGSFVLRLRSCTSIDMMKRSAGT